MAIIRSEDVATGKEIVVVKGVVAQIAFKEITDGPDKFGNTHRASIRIDDDWINNINIKVKEDFDPAIRFNAGTTTKTDWVNLAVGDEIRIVVQENEYNGKIYMNSGTSKITLVKKGEDVPVKETASGGTVKEAYKPRDSSGIETGHALNGALNLVRGGGVEDVVEAAKVVHTLTLELKKEYAVKNPGMSEYDVGAMVGHAVLNATRDASSCEEVEEIARDLLENLVPVVAAFVKGTKEETPAKSKAVTKPTSKKPTTPKKESAKEVVQSEDPGPTLSDFDDDIPF